MYSPDSRCWSAKMRWLMSISVEDFMVYTF